MDDKLRFLVDDEPIAPKIKGALPLPNLGDMSRKVVEISTDGVAESVARAVSKFYTIIQRMPEDCPGYKLESIRFSLVIDASGEIAILSAVKGGLSGHTGLEFTISRA
jgi:hypothetical protein